MRASAEVNITNLFNVAEEPTEIVRPYEVVQLLTEMQGQVDWQPTEDGGLLLTVPTEQWEQLESIVQEEKEHTLVKRGRRPQDRIEELVRRRGAITKRQVDGPISGGHQGDGSKRGLWTEAHCYRSGSWGYLDILAYSLGCGWFNYSVSGGLTQVYVSQVGTNIYGQPMQWWMRFTNYGLISGWDYGDCVVASYAAANSCKGGNPMPDTQGGWADVFTGQWNGPGRGSKGASHHIDPTTLNCNC